MILVVDGSHSNLDLRSELLVVSLMMFFRLSEERINAMLDEEDELMIV